MEKIDEISLRVATKFKTDEWNIEKVHDDPIPYLAALIKSVLQEAKLEGYGEGVNDMAKEALKVGNIY